MCVCALVSKSANYRRRLCQKYNFFFIPSLDRQERFATHVCVCENEEKKTQQSHEKNWQRHSQEPRLTFIEIRLSPMTKKPSEKKIVKSTKHTQNYFTTPN